MDNLTHTLFAATVARTSIGRAGRGTTAVLVLASNAPDLDVVAAVGGGLGYLDWHRGPTHGPVGVILLGALAGGLVWLVMHWRDRRRPSGTRSAPAASLPMLVALGLLGVALHIGMDLPTSYGTRVLSPFRSDWLTTDWMPIVDVYLLALLSAGLLMGRRTTHRWLPLTVLLLMATNYGVRAVAHDQAIALAPHAFGPRLPSPCGEAPFAPATITRWAGHPRIPAPPGPGGRCLIEVAAIPTFLSPFRWQLIARTSNAYELHAVDLWRARGPEAGRQPWQLSRRVPDHWTPAVVRAAESDAGRRFLSFSRFPAARSVLEEDGSTTVWWTDMRYAPGPATPRVSPDRRRLFSATVRVAADGRILDDRLGR